MPLTRRRVTDAAALKALAHPVRIALLEALVSEGPLTASQAAALLDESPSNCSWHLRKLAEHGFVREARGAAGRNRPWRAVSEGLEWGEDAPGDPGVDAGIDVGGDAGGGAGGDDAAENGSGRLAADALTDMLVARELQRLRAARASRDSEPAAWREATGLVRSQLWLTAQEAERLRADLTTLLLTHADRAGRPELRPDGARLVSLVAWLVPSGPHRVQPEDAEAPS